MNICHRSSRDGWESNRNAFRLALQRRKAIEIPTQVAFVEVDVAHHHDVRRVAEYPAQPLDLAAGPQVFSGKGVPEAVSTNAEPDSGSDAPEQFSDADKAHRATIGQKQEIA
jgi:hypothetical protein